MRNFDFKRYTPRPKKLLRASLRHKYRDKCGELAPISSLGNMSLCVNYPFLSNYLRNQTRILSNKTKCTACRSLACTICVKWKKTDWPKSAVIDDYFTFCTLEDYQTNATLWSHSTVCIGYTSISRNEGKQEHAAFQGCFGQRFGCQDNKPLTKCPEVSDHTSFLHPPPPLLDKPLQPLENPRPNKLSTQEW